jgi:hypothetical protein
MMEWVVCSVFMYTCVDVHNTSTCYVYESGRMQGGGEGERLTFHIAQSTPPATHSSVVIDVFSAINAGVCVVLACSMM